MALRCAQCGNQTRFEARRPAVMRFAVYPDNQRQGEIRQEKLPLGWEVQGEGELACRNCGSTNVTRNGAS
jgi:hypothetical protein